MGGVMNSNELLNESKEIIATGCGCDRWCESTEGSIFGCSCLSDAKHIIFLVAETAISVVGKWSQIHIDSNDNTHYSNITEEIQKDLRKQFYD